MKYWKRDLFLMLLLMGGFYLLTSLARPFANPDEGRYVEIPREMLQRGDWVLPRLNGVYFFEKPPLFYWLQAIAIKVGGLSFGSARFLNGFLALMCCTLVYLTARRLYGRHDDAFGRTAGWAAALSLGSMVLYFALSQVITLDVLTCFTLSVTLCCFILGMLEPPGRLRFWLAMGAYSFMALAVLSKGLIGIALPGGIAFLWLLLGGQWRRLLPLYVWPGMGLFLAIALPWHVIAAVRHPDFLSFYFVHEQILRYLTPIHGRMQPMWFPGVVFLLGLFPSLVFLPHATVDTFRTGWKSLLQEAPQRLFFFFWMLFIVGFYSFSHSKLVTYVLPAYPAAALFMAPFFAKAWHQPRTLSLGSSYRILTLVCLAAASAIPFIVWIRAHKIAVEVLPIFALMMVFLVCAACFFWDQRRNSYTRAALIHPVIFMAICALFFNPIARWVQAPSTRLLAQTIRDTAQPEDQIFVLRNYLQDLPVYLQACVGIVDNRNHELEFGLARQPEAMAPSTETFMQRWSTDPHLFLIAHQRDLQELRTHYPQAMLPIIATQGPFVLLSNKRSSPKAQPNVSLAQLDVE